MLIIGQVNEFTPFTETGNFRLFPPPMMEIVRHGLENIFSNVIKSRIFISFNCFFLSINRTLQSQPVPSTEP